MIPCQDLESPMNKTPEFLYLAVLVVIMNIFLCHSTSDFINDGDLGVWKA